MSTATKNPTRTHRFLLKLRADHLSGLRFLPEGSPEREAARREIETLNAEIQALKA